jgi:hypothetical protein
VTKSTFCPKNILPVVVKAGNALIAISRFVGRLAAHDEGLL